VQTVFRHYPKAIAGDEEAVHQVRVSGRRLRVALPLLARKPKGKRVRRVSKGIKQLVRTAGAGRDLDVILALFERETAHELETRPEVRTLRSRLKAARARSRRQLVDALLDFEVASLRRDLRRIVSRGPENLFKLLSRIRASRDGEGAILEVAIRELGSRFDPGALHDIRIRSRRLRYIAEIDAAIKEAPSQAAPLFKDMQARLGRIQDASVLASWLGPLAARAEARGSLALASEARRQAARFLRLSRRFHREYLEQNPAALVRRALESLGRKDFSAA
jgi:CHAD domain-containing protein